MTYKTTYRNGKTDREHRFIAKEILGRELLSNEVVHHIDGNKRNNDPSNLMIVTRAEHAKIHGRDIDRSKPVIQMDKDGGFIKQWGSAKEVSETLSVYRGNISKCCKGKLKTTGGYSWKYAV